MASSTASNVSNTNYTVQESLDLVASTFVRQYFTMLNKAPHLIHNFYSHHSTFIYGTIEMSSDESTEPIVGRENIMQKMENLKLNDCRAKIERIDCLKTLADGLVIQVIGELSNNGKAMRRFLQTFVLARGPNNDMQNQHQPNQRHPNDRRGPSTNDAVNPKSKFFVLNSIFRYQGDGADSESEVDVASVNSSVSAANDEQVVTNKPYRGQDTSIESGQTQSKAYVQNVKQKQNNDSSVVSRKSETDVERLADELDDGVRIGKQHISTAEDDNNKQDIPAAAKVVSNGTGDSSSDKKNGIPEKSTENGKTVAEQRSQHGSTTTTAAAVTTTTTTTTNPVQPKVPQSSLASTNTTTNRPQIPAEPKTWAKMVRNTPSWVRNTSAQQPLVSPRATSERAAAKQRKRKRERETEKHTQHTYNTHSTHNTHANTQTHTSTH